MARVLNRFRSTHSSLPHITISQHDGASDSKPTSNPPTHAITSPTSSTTHSRGTRAARIKKYIIPSIFRERPIRTNTNDDDDFYGDVVMDESPMRVVSPRSTNLEPPAPTRGRSFSFKRKEEGKMHKKAKSMGMPLRVNIGMGQEVSGGSGLGAGVVTQDAVQSPQLSKEGMGMGGLDVPKSPTRDAALTSHPVGRIQEVDEESQYETPASGGGSGKSGFFGKK